MKFIYLLGFLLVAAHLNAQENKKQTIATPTIFHIAEQMPMFRDTTCINLTSYNAQKPARIKSY